MIGILHRSRFIRGFAERILQDEITNLDRRLTEAMRERDAAYKSRDLWRGVAFDEAEQKRDFSAEAARLLEDIKAVEEFADQCADERDALREELHRLDADRDALELKVDALESSIAEHAERLDDALAAQGEAERVLECVTDTAVRALEKALELLTREDLDGPFNPVYRAAAQAYTDGLERIQAAHDGEIDC